MIYIRTAEGIHSVEAVPLSNGRIRYSLSNEDSLISKEHLEKITIKEADTIEELCDCWVLVGSEKDQDGNPRIWTKTQKSQWFVEWQYTKCNTIYGAIWTERGLIYVTKMDDKGELELI